MRFWVEVELMSALPEILTFSDGRPITTLQEWQVRRGKIAEWLTRECFGATPQATGRAESLGWDWYRIYSESWPTASFMLRAYLPDGDGPHPCMIWGDACWDGMTKEVIADFNSRGIGVLAFNRLELAPDEPTLGVSGLRRAIADKGGPVPGAIACWAWGISLVIDAAEKISGVDPARLGVTGHSRGGKTALFAGALDERLSVVCDNQSGCMGSASLLHIGEKGERLGDIVGNFPFWFSPELAKWVGREEQMGFDLHHFKAMIAPRALLYTGSVDDLWANQAGVEATNAEAAKVWSFLGSEQAPEMVWRKGEHGHWPEDFRVQAEFAARVWGL
jgi:hypothetical protein